MKRTIAWPPRLVAGGLAMTADPNDPVATDDQRGEALRQIIRLRLNDGRTTNPFQASDGLGIDDPTFTPSTVGASARLRSEVTRHFRRLEREKRAKLVGLTIGTATALLIVGIEYEDLETGGRSRMELARNA